MSENFIDKEKLIKRIESWNLNFLIWAWASTPFLPLLWSIEEDIKKCWNDMSKKIKKYEEYYNKVMLPNLQIKDEVLNKYVDKKLKEVWENYEKFFIALNQVLLKRKMNILWKQANIFTTNIDVFMETILEKLLIDYNDWFSWNFQPKLMLSNFKKSIFKRSTHFDYKSEIPMLNIVKLHWSLNWEEKEKMIIFSMLEKVSNLKNLVWTPNFLEEYKKLMIVNPEETKYQETVLLYYYEMLRLFSSELEKENAILFIIWFSLNDNHIQEILVRCSNSNPTLHIYILAKETSSIHKKIIEESKYKNIEVVIPQDKWYFDLWKIWDIFLDIIWEKDLKTILKKKTKSFFNFLKF